METITKERKYTYMKDTIAKKLFTNETIGKDLSARVISNVLNADYPKFKRKGVNNSYRTNCIKSTYKGKSYSNIEIDLEKRMITLPKLGNVKYRGYRKLNKN